MWDSILSPSSENNTAAVPPSAETECERIAWTFEITPISSFSFVFAHEIAARNPAKPVPIISTSCDMWSVK
jgi:hypothetical protein